MTKEIALLKPRITGPVALMAGLLAARAAIGAGTDLEEIVVTGTRMAGVKAVDSLGPVDVLAGTDLGRSARASLGDALSEALPSLDLQPVGFDLANETLAIRMNGLSPNHTLVLLNGKRLHGTANLAVLAGPYQGGAAPDLAFVPLQSVANVEVLRDGAAAQYGSDAIAGVVNIRLKSVADGGSASLTHGAYHRGDGITTTAAANAGFDLGEGGFVNLTTSLQDHGFSNAGGPDQRVERAIASGSHPAWNTLPGYPLLNKVFGDAKYRTWLASVNAELPLADSGSLYFFGTWGTRRAGGWANFRLPTKLPELYPKGFTPIDWLLSDDMGLNAGWRGAVAGWSVDLGSTYGYNHNRVEVTGSANVDLFRDTGATPRDFRNGNLDGSQWIINLDATRQLAMGAGMAATLAVGSEYRRETYSISAGDPASRYKAGSQSFPGFSTSDAGSTARTVEAAYAELSIAPRTGLQLAAAGRYERYSDFGNAMVGKLSGRLAFTDALALRASASNGFRAPTLAEGRYSATNVQPNSAFVQLPPNSPAARLIGIDPLAAERSTNLNLGIVTRASPRASLTLDAYQIDVRNRIVGSGTLYGSYAGRIRSAAVNAAIVANGNTLENVPFSGVNVFTNGIDTRTRGAELVVSVHQLDTRWLSGWSLSASYNQTQVTHVPATPTALAASGQQLFDKVAISDLETASPRFKAVLASTHVVGPFTARLRNTLFGPSSGYVDPGDGQYYLNRIGTKLVTDLDLEYRISPRIALTAGAKNLFNVMPDRVNAAGLSASAAAGNPAVEIFPSFSPLGINGGYYFARMDLDL